MIYTWPRRYENILVWSGSIVVRHLETRKRITKCKRYKDGLKSVLSKTRLVPSTKRLTPSPALKTGTSESTTKDWWHGERWPMKRRQWRECRIQPRGLRRSSDGLRTPGMCDVTMSPLSFQSCIANHCMTMCLARSVRRRALIILIADSLSIKIFVALDCPKPKSRNTERKYRAVLAAETAARNSASVELVAVMDGVLDRYATAALAKQNSYSVVERRCRKSLA
jgi:hypothetical protein